MTPPPSPPALEERASPLRRVLADHGEPANFPGRRVRITAGALGAWLERSRLPGAATLAEVALGLACWRASRRAPLDWPFVTRGSTSGFLFAALQALTRMPGRRRTHVMYDLLLDAPSGGLHGLRDALRRWAFRRAVDLAVVWGKTDVALYAAAHGLPRERLAFLPYHITLEDYAFEVRDDGFVFAGGNFGRDYPTLIRALAEVKAPVVIATQRAEVAALARPFPHMTVRGVTPAEYRRLLATCRLVVECHDPTFFRTAGHQMMLNAHWLGKPLVMADPRSAEGYLEDGVDALVVPAGDAEGVRTAVTRLLDSPALRARLADAGRARVRSGPRETLPTMQAIYNLALDADARRRTGAPAWDRIACYGR